MQAIEERITGRWVGGWLAASLSWRAQQPPQGARLVGRLEQVPRPACRAQSRPDARVLAPPHSALHRHLSHPQPTWRRTRWWTPPSARAACCPSSRPRGPASPSGCALGCVLECVPDECVVGGRRGSVRALLGVSCRPTLPAAAARQPRGQRTLALSPADAMRPSSCRCPAPAGAAAQGRRQQAGVCAVGDAAGGGAHRQVRRRVWRDGAGSCGRWVDGGCWGRVGHRLAWASWPSKRGASRHRRRTPRTHRWSARRPPHWCRLSCHPPPYPPQGRGRLPGDRGGLPGRAARQPAPVREPPARWPASPPL